MTLVQARTLFRALLGVRSTAGTWDDPTVDLLLNMAQREVWRRIAAYNHEICTNEETETYTANAASINITSLTYDLETIVAMFWAEAAGGITVSNMPIPIMPSNNVDIEKYGTDPSNTDYRNFRYAIGTLKTLIIRPIPTTALNLIIRYIPTPADLSASVNVFGDALPHLHDLVVFKALRYAAVKANTSREFARLEADAWEAALPSLDSTLQMPMGQRHVYSD